MLVVAALAVGVLVGLISGLTGIGGGVLMVPFLYVIYAGLGVATHDATALAHATSLAVIVPTALRGLIGYRGTGYVQLRAALPLAVSGAISAAVMAQFAPRLPSTALRLGFGIFLVSVSLDLMLRRVVHSEMPDHHPRHVVLAALLGIPVGALSAALGVGGGVPATLGLHYLLDLPFQVIPATSLAIIAVTGAAGSISYLFQPLQEPLAGVVGHVDFLHGAPLALGAVIAAPWGVRLNRRLSAQTMRRMFGVFLLAIGTLLMVQNG